MCSTAIIDLSPSSPLPLYIYDLTVALLRIVMSSEVKTQGGMFGRNRWQTQISCLCPISISYLNGGHVADIDVGHGQTSLFGFSPLHFFSVSLYSRIILVVSTELSRVHVLSPDGELFPRAVPPQMSSWRYHVFKKLLQIDYRLGSYFGTSRIWINHNTLRVFNLQI